MRLKTLEILYAVRTRLRPIWNFFHPIRYFKARKKEKQLAQLMATEQGMLKVAEALVKPFKTKLHQTIRLENLENIKDYKRRR